MGAFVGLWLHSQNAQAQIEVTQELHLTRYRRAVGHVGGEIIDPARDLLDRRDTVVEVRQVEVDSVGA